MYRLAALRDRFWRGVGNASELVEIRQIEAAHGVGPKALAALRWRIDVEDSEPTPRRTPARVRYGHLRPAGD